MERFSTYLGYLAGVLTVLSFIPQVVQVWRTRRTGDLSFGMFALLVTASSLWFAYGLFTRDWPVVLTNAAMVILNGAILTAKIRFK